MRTENSTVKIVPVILCGGSGTRLWPLSRESYPKQFIDLGNGKTLFKYTLARVSDQTLFFYPLIVCNEKYRFYVDEEMNALKIKGDLILEPMAKNTAPAIAMAAYKLVTENPGREPLMLVLPADHYLNDVSIFIETVLKTAPYAETGKIITYGIPPAGPATGYGYIRCGDGCGDVAQVREFIEKPDFQTASQLAASADCFWNSGIFLFKPSVYLEDLAQFSPEIKQHCEAAWNDRKINKHWIYPGYDEFTSSPADSIDYAVMEKTGRAMVAPLPVVWDDLGTWDAFHRYAEKDAANNACIGDIIMDNVENSYIHSTHRLIAAIDVKDLTIVETRDSILVARNSDTQKVKNIVTILKQKGSSKYKHHPLVYRPWGSYESLAVGDRFQVKRIIVNPGQILSLQMHHHRAEHWIVVKGTAEVTNGQEVRLFTENQSTYIPVGVNHRLRNPGLIPLELIEIQSGSYLGEDDIVRLEDVYGRNREEKSGGSGE